MPESAIDATGTDETTDLSPVALQIIIAAGDARELVFQAGDAAADFDFDSARELLARAHEKLQEAHRTHTDQIQAEAAGESLPYSLLFAHAQDTLMTANSEFRVVKKTFAVLERLDARVSQLEKEIAR